MNEEITNVIDKLKKPENFNYYTNYGWAHSLLICDADTIIEYVEKTQNNWNELNKFIEEEKNRLATQVGNIYEDSLDKIHFVNEDIFNELTKVSKKMQELENSNNESNNRKNKFK